MEQETLEDIQRRVEALTPNEQLSLVVYLVQRIRDAYSDDQPRPKWSDLCGLAPCPMMGEDAQAWVTRTRRESDEQRERQWRRAE